MKNLKHIWKYMINFNTVWNNSLHANMPWPSGDCFLSYLIADRWRSFISAEPLRQALFMPQKSFSSDNTWKAPKYLIELISKLVWNVLILLILCPAFLKRQQNHSSLRTKKTRSVSNKAARFFFPFQQLYSKKKEASGGSGRKCSYSCGIPPAWIHLSVPRQRQWAGQLSFPGLAIKYKKTVVFTKQTIYILEISTTLLSEVLLLLKCRADNQ